MATMGERGPAPVALSDTGGGNERPGGDGNGGGC